MTNLENKPKRIFMAALLALLSTIGITLTIKTADKTVLGNSIYSLVIFSGIYVLLRYCLSLARNRNKNIGAAIVSLVLSISLVWGRNTMMFDDAQVFSAQSCLRILLIWPLWFGLIRVLFSLHIKDTLVQEQTIVKITRFASMRRGLITIWAVILICWLPYLIAYFPGVYGYDGPGQIGEFLTHNINSHHPVLHTYLLGITIGRLKSPWWLGAAIYSAFQTLVLSFALADVTSFIARHTRSLLLPLGSLVVFALLPFYPIMAVTTTKNVIFTGLFIGLELQLIKIAWEKDYFNDWRKALLFGIISFLSMAFLRQAMYVYVLTVIILCCLLKHSRSRLLLTAGVAVGVFMLYSGPILSSFNITTNRDDAIKEALSVPECQIARAVVRHPHDYQGQKLKEVKKFIPDYSNYRGPLEAISDPVKTTFNAKAVRQEPLEFIKLYFAVGRKYPAEYVNAFCRLTVQLWYPGMNKDTLAFGEPYYEVHSLSLLPSQPRSTFGKSLLPSFKKAVDTFSNRQYYEKIPMVSLLFSAALPFFIMIVGIGKILVDKQRQSLVVFIMPLIFWGILLVFSPVILLRYVLPLISIEGLLMLPIVNDFCNGKRR